MKLEKKIVTLKNGAVCILRSAEETDAQQMIDNLKITASETDFLLRYPEEVDYTLEQEQKILSDYAQSPRSLMLVAEIDSDCRYVQPFPCRKAFQGHAPLHDGNLHGTEILGTRCRHCDDADPSGKSQRSRLRTDRAGSCHQK